MAFARSEYEAAQAMKAAKAVKERARDLEGQKRSALLVSQVTGDKHWDHFLSFVNERLQGLETEKAAALNLLETSDNFSTEDLINQKLAVRLIGREIQALTWVIELPQTILEQGDRAKQLLGSIDENTH
jgi:hypothetical protein